MKVTTDKYELPIAVAESVDELARILRLKRSTVQGYIYHKKEGYIVVDSYE